MDYGGLERFIHKDMRMTHIYQPIMIKALLESSDNTATVDEIARKFLNEDESQLNYYKQVTRRWPHITLKKRGVITYSRGVYRLAIDRRLRPEERGHLVELCDLRLGQFVDGDPWIKKIRELDKASVNSSLRYDVLSRSRGVCVACGARSTEAMLHVDHIIPRSRGGATEMGNLQALCYKCNTQKRDRDELDFLRHHNRLKFRKRHCRLCGGAGDLVLEAAPEDPASRVHRHVAPARHVGSFMEMIPAERQLCLNLVDEVVGRAMRASPSATFDVTGFDRRADHFHIDVVQTMVNNAGGGRATP